MTSTMSTPSTGLQGPWLFAVRLAWLLVAVHMMSMFITGLPGTYRAHANDYSALSQVMQQRGLPTYWLPFYIVGWQSVASLSFSVVALAIAWRKSGDWMGLFASAACLAFGVGVSIPFGWGDDVFQSILPEMLIPLMVRIWTILAWTFSVVILYLFPDGKFMPRWTRWLALFWGLWTVGGGFFPILNIMNYSFAIVVSIQVIMYGTGVVVQVYRYTRISTPTQRQQSKWVVWGVVGTLVGFVIAYLVWSFTFSTQLQEELAWLLVILPFYYVPRTILAVAIGMAILRFRLWDIDYIINRSLVYGALTFLLGSVLVGVFALTQAMLGILVTDMQAGAAGIVSVIVVNRAVLAGPGSPATARRQPALRCRSRP
jgi:hypothetical protein